MGAWGPAILSNDVAADVRAAYRELLEDQVEDAEATRRLLEQFKEHLKDYDEGPVVWLSLADTQSRVGRLEAQVKREALRVIEGEEGVRTWQHDSKLLAKRKEALTKLKRRLEGPQPPRRTLRPPRRHVTDLEPGDVLMFREGQKVRIVRVARLLDHRLDVEPILVPMMYEGTEPPNLERLATVPDGPIRSTKVAPGLPSWIFYRALPTTVKGMGWRDAGFVRLGQIPRRTGDEQTDWWTGGRWDVVARSLMSEARWEDSGWYKSHLFYGNDAAAEERRRTAVSAWSQRASLKYRRGQ